MESVASERTFAPAWPKPTNATADNAAHKRINTPEVIPKRPPIVILEAINLIPFGIGEVHLDRVQPAFGPTGRSDACDCSIGRKRREDKFGPPAASPGTGKMCQKAQPE